MTTPVRALPTFHLLPGETLVATGAPRPESWLRVFIPQALTCVLGLVTIPLVPLGWWMARRQVARHRYWLTDRRLVVQEGLIGQRVRSVPLDRVVDVAITQNWLDRLFGVVNLDVRDMTGEVGAPNTGATASMGLRLFDVDAPESWQREILARTGRAPVPGGEGGEMGEVVALLQQLVDRSEGVLRA